MPQRLRHIDRGGELQIAGFTLVELMIVVTIIGLLLSIALPEFSNYRLNAKIARTASEMRSLSTGFVAYKAGMFVYPEESHETLPPGMEQFINPAIWADETPLGGHYNCGKAPTSTRTPDCRFSTLQRPLTPSLYWTRCWTTGTWRRGSSGTARTAVPR